METTVQKIADDNINMEGNVSIVSVKEEPKIVNKDIDTKLPSDTATSRKTMKEEKARKKDDRSVEQVLKALNSLETTEEKLAAMCKKYADTVDENRRLQLSLKQAEKRLIVLQREKEQLQTEHSKAVLTRSRLESLCRELQRQNKAVKDESLLKIREEEEKRKEVSGKFQSTLADVTALMQQNNEKNCKLREDNLEMTKKFKSICEQYELREQQVEKISKQLQLESQLADAKLAKAKMEMTAEKEILLREKQQLLMEVVECQAKIQDLQATETSLRSQISLYTNKYDEFQNALSRSNDVFEGFKGEMEKMSKKICKLEKETSSWKQRWEKSHQALLEMAADKQQRDSELQLANRQLAQLQKLCRTLQAERTSLLAQLKTSAKPGAADRDGTEMAEKGQGEEKNNSFVPNLESTLIETEQSELGTTQPTNLVSTAPVVLENVPSSGPSQGADVSAGVSENTIKTELSVSDSIQPTGLVLVTDAVQVAPVVLENVVSSSNMSLEIDVSVGITESSAQATVVAEEMHIVKALSQLALDASKQEKTVNVTSQPVLSETCQQESNTLQQETSSQPVAEITPLVSEQEIPVVSILSQSVSEVVSPVSDGTGAVLNEQVQQSILHVDNAVQASHTENVQTEVIPSAVEVTETSEQSLVTSSALTQNQEVVTNSVESQSSPKNKSSTRPAIENKKGKEVGKKRKK